MSTDRIEKRTVLRAPVSRVWRALTDTTEFARWFGFTLEGPFTPGKTDAGVFRPSNSTWFIQRSTAGTLIQQFGATGDVPLPSAFVR